MNNFIGIYDGAVNQEYCNEMINELEMLLEQSSSSNELGEDANGGVVNRKDSARFFEIDSPRLAMQTYAVLDSCIDKYREEYPAFDMIRSYSRQVKVQRTLPMGGFHKWHCENLSDLTSRRVLAWMIYLNDTDEGDGTTEFISQGLRVQPKAGTVVLFPAGWTHTHRGNPVYNSNKYIATGWYCAED